MAEEFYADTDAIAKYEPYMRELGSRLKGIGTRLTAAEDSLWDCWGDDNTGHQFYSQYQPGSKRIKEAVLGSAGLFESTSDGIKTMAKGLDAMESDNVFAARSLAEPTTPTARSNGGAHE
ncbi:hypothetical protein RVR_2458 [Actinacidiphila reveromycinica]|uniref:WXG100 family type VII secretion target n=1 Tax=Actinacidiphila reveromycinica TaxID=659352 RepID=A0A7U3UQI0_9ACTN|nr:hypothetical protein [Streptomyces sp. SN-593]BBA96932.1 hypothetical protein RVR_2458 [Streptomyces sp. SN-593]